MRRKITHNKKLAKPPTAKELNPTHKKQKQVSKNSTYPQVLRG